ncbi:hypothetical protein LNTAR_04946 [Lentisphaera araneosa HTCC2155]|jgi:hypothetical protein|uniref:Uncharacterized protein n=1 Tax=Lentisphaera araneosa HTCC2155 TaxID=313628 RepID=A6DLH6_9BACT|nr:hypothetical protein [Lentisphaera araneosa]EDM27431.1 hypothetical protein LNTAR_04946 [Lentisphaera araneosa HTCC2155]
MSEKPTVLIERLSRYVDDLLKAKQVNNRSSMKGRTQMIMTVLDKLREIYKNKPFSKELVAQIQENKKRANLLLPTTSSNYFNNCWDCLIKRGEKVIIDKRVDTVCKSCGWVQCHKCGACKDPKYGRCKNREYFHDH